MRVGTNLAITTASNLRFNSRFWNEEPWFRSLAQLLWHDVATKRMLEWERGGGH